MSSFVFCTALSKNAGVRTGFALSEADILAHLLVAYSLRAGLGIDVAMRVGSDDYADIRLCRVSRNNMESESARYPIVSMTSMANGPVIAEKGAPIWSASSSARLPWVAGKMAPIADTQAGIASRGQVAPVRKKIGKELGISNRSPVSALRNHAPTAQANAAMAAPIRSATKASICGEARPGTSCRAKNQPK